MSQEYRGHLGDRLWGDRRLSKKLNGTVRMTGMTVRTFGTDRIIRTDRMIKTDKIVRTDRIFRRDQDTQDSQDRQDCRNRQESFLVHWLGTWYLSTLFVIKWNGSWFAESWGALNSWLSLREKVRRIMHSGIYLFIILDEYKMRMKAMVQATIITKVGRSGPTYF